MTQPMLWAWGHGYLISWPMADRGSGQETFFFPIWISVILESQRYYYSFSFLNDFFIVFLSFIPFVYVYIILFQF